VKKIYDLCGGINDSQELAINLKSLQEQWRIKQEEKNKKIQTELSGQEITSLEQELNKKKQEIDYLQQKLREKSELVLSVLESYLIDRKEKLTTLLLQVENKLDENGQQILTSLRQVDENNPLLKQITENLCQKQLPSE
jgi:predicted RNase H-like nuclease (RuvC/YqgF family)